MLTSQLIAPGRACPSNDFLRQAYEATGAPLYITSANRSRHVSGEADAPAHWRADRLRAEFAAADGGSELVVLEHPDEAAARQAYPLHLPMSTTILAFHRTREVAGRPVLIVERHGSLPVDVVARVVRRHGFAVEVAPAARTRLAPREYDGAEAGHSVG
jgi:hypothetical protein